MLNKRHLITVGQIRNTNEYMYRNVRNYYIRKCYSFLSFVKHFGDYNNMLRRCGGDPVLLANTCEKNYIIGHARSDFVGENLLDSKYDNDYDKKFDIPDNVYSLVYDDDSMHIYKVTLLQKLVNKEFEIQNIDKYIPIDSDMRPSDLVEQDSLETMVKVQEQNNTERELETEKELYGDDNSDELDEEIMSDDEEGEENTNERNALIRTYRIHSRMEETFTMIEHADHTAEDLYFLLICIQFQLNVKHNCKIKIPKFNIV